MDININKNFSQVLLIILCFSSVSCDALYRLLDKEGAEEKELVGEVIPFEINPTIQEVQTLLNLYGYNPGKIDGALGLRTRNAIERFQKDNNLETSRFVDQNTWAKLSVFKDKGLIVDNKLNVKLVQEILLASGINIGVADGKFGPKTREAVRTFQKANNLKVDGKVGYKTLSAFAEYLIEEDNP